MRATAILALLFCVGCVGEPDASTYEFDRVEWEEVGDDDDSAA